MYNSVKQTKREICQVSRLVFSLSSLASNPIRVQNAALFLFLPIELFCCSRKKHIAAAVEGGFDGVLDDSDDEADSYRLHGDIVTDTKERANHRNEEQKPPLKCFVISHRVGVLCSRFP